MTNFLTYIYRCIYIGEIRSIHTILELRLKKLQLLPQITTCTQLEMGILGSQWWT